RSVAEAEGPVRGGIGAVDGFEVVDVFAGAPPALDHPLLARLVEEADGTPRGKLGWTDVARFAAHGVPAVNFGPGDPEVAHTAEEHVTRHDLERVHAGLRRLLERGAGPWGRPPRRPPCCSGAG